MVESNNTKRNGDEGTTVTSSTTTLSPSNSNSNSNSNSTSTSTKAGVSYGLQTKWLENHPVVSMLLWALGTESVPANKSDPSNADKWNANSSSPLSKEPKAMRKSSLSAIFEELTAMTSDSRKESGKENNNHYHLNNVVSTSTSKKTEIEDERDAMENPSPNWGFYVAITPEQQEMYARTNGWRNGAKVK